MKPAWPDGHSKSFCSNLKYDSQKSNQTDLKFGLWKYETAKLIMNQLKHLIKTGNNEKAVSCITRVVAWSDLDINNRLANSILNFTFSTLKGAFRCPLNSSGEYDESSIKLSLKK